jgi:hypothetical protein
MSEERDGSGIFKLEFGKRHQRTGLTDKAGNAVKEIYLRHSTTGVVWERNVDIENAEQAKALDDARKQQRIKDFIVKHETVSLQQLKDNARLLGYGKNSIGGAARRLGQESKLSTQVIYAFDAHIDGSRTLAGVFSIHPEPKDKSVQLKNAQSAG